MQTNTEGSLCPGFRWQFIWVRITMTIVILIFYIIIQSTVILGRAMIHDYGEWINYRLLQNYFQCHCQPFLFTSYYILKHKTISDVVFVVLKATWKQKCICSTCSGEKNSIHTDEDIDLDALVAVMTEILFQCSQSFDLCLLATSRLPDISIFILVPLSLLLFIC